MLLYHVALGRAADSGGLKAFCSHLGGGVPLGQIAGDMIRSAEFASKWRDPDATPALALELYSKALGPQAAVAALGRLGDGWHANGDAGEALARLIELEPPLDLPCELRPRSWVENNAEGYQLWQVWSGRGAPARAAGAAKLTLVMPYLLADGGTWQSALESLNTQTHDDFELLAPASVARAIRHKTLSARVRAFEAGALTPMALRIRRAIDLASGEMTAFVAPGDVLDPDALREAAGVLTRRSSIGVVFADEDQVDSAGRRTDPWFKTDWDDEAMCGADQVGRSAFMATAKLRQALGQGALDPVAWEYELLWRVADLTAPEDVVHLPKVLIHRCDRPRPGPSAQQRRATVAQHLSRVGACAAITVASRDRLRLVHPLPKAPPLVSVVIPTRDKAALLGECLAGLTERTDYRNLQIIVVDNQSVEPQTAALLEPLRARPGFEVLSYPHPFNWGAINNFAVERVAGEIVMLLNNDTTVIEPGWLTELVAQALRPEVGVVAPTLLYGDGTVQHAGIAFGPGGATAHLARGADPDGDLYHGRLGLARSVSAVTGACMVLRRDAYRTFGGVEAGNLRVTWSDTDLCFKAWGAGLRVVITPFSRLAHIELATRGADNTPEALARAQSERAWMERRWGARLDRDPFFNPAIDPDTGNLILNW